MAKNPKMSKYQKKDSFPSGGCFKSAPRGPSETAPATQFGALPDAMTKAREQAELAYQFTPNSYTYSALIAIAKAASVIEGHANPRKDD